MENDDIRAWIDTIKARGLTDTVRVALDVLEPLGVLGAQILYVAQPAAGIFRAGDLVGSLAQILEKPDGIETLRGYLDGDSVAQDLAAQDLADDSLNEKAAD